MFPPQWHTHCRIAERSSKHMRHSGLLPGSCSSKSCPWSGREGGRAALAQAGQPITLHQTSGAFGVVFFPLNGVCHWPHVAPRPSLSVALVMVSLSLYLSLFSRLSTSEFSASKRMIPIRTEPWESCALVQSAVQWHYFPSLPKGPKLFLCHSGLPDTQNGSCRFSFFLHKLELMP